MRISAVRSLIVISLVVALVVAGTTMAWFTDEYSLPSAAEMVVGTLEFEITDARVIDENGGEGGDEGQTLTWVAGECKELSWTFKNTGTKTAFFRARPEGIFTGYTYTGKETAWGEGYDFPGGNWAMYFKHNKGSETETRLLAGQHHDAGKVRVWEEGGKLKVRYETNANWRLAKTHLAVADKMENFPLVGNGNPPPGKFPYKGKHNLVRSYTYEIPPIPNYNPMYIAAHSEVVGDETEGNVTDDYDKITWSLPDGSPWQKGSDGWFYYCEPVRNGEEITLVLRGCLDEDAVGGIYEVKLKAESVQTTHGAAAEEWPGWPCGQ